MALCFKCICNSELGYVSSYAFAYGEILAIVTIHLCFLKVPGETMMLPVLVVFQWHCRVSCVQKIVRI